MNTLLTSGLQNFADRIKNDPHWSQYFEADHALLMEAIAELKTKRTAPPAATVVPEDVAKDAERYRYLRNPSIDVGKVIDKWVGPHHWSYEYRAGKELDDAIDAAMLSAAPAPSQDNGGAA